MRVHRTSPEDAALVVVDAQNDFCHLEGAASRAGFDVTGLADAADRLRRLVGAARRVGLPVVFVRTTHDEDVDSPAWRYRTLPGIDSHLPPAPVNCRTGTWGSEFFEVSPEDGEPVVTKHRYSAFHRTELDAILRRRGRRSLLFAGFTTNVCVETSLRDGLCHDYLVSIVEDCCGAFDPGEHAAAVANIRRYFGLVFTSDELISAWGGSGQLAVAVAGNDGADLKDR